MTLATVNLQGILARGVAIIALTGLPLASSMAQSPNAFGVPTETVSYTHLTLPTNREV